MALGPRTAVVNGQRFDLPGSGAYFPIAFGPQTQGVPQVSPTMPPFMGGGVSGSASAVAAVNGYGTADNNTSVTAIAAAHPFNWKVSPIWWAVGGLILSLLLLQKIHWRRTLIQGEEQFGLGRERERAEVEV